jgi:predicted lipid-binding transport protein (Tim44 family)
MWMEIVFFAMVAGFLILRLISILGRRTGEENPERWRRSPPPTQGPGTPTPGSGSDTLPDNVTRFPDRGTARGDANLSLDPLDPAIATGLAAIRSLDPSFDAGGFVNSARAAFEMIVGAFAQGDERTLAPLLAPDVMKNFSDAIRDRRQEHRVLETTLIGFKSSDLVGARVEESRAFVTVRFVSEQVNVTKDSTGAVIDGDATRVDTITDVWTFSRDTRSRDPNWLLTTTSEAG